MGSIIDQARNSTYNIPKVLSDYLKSLYENECFINDTQTNLNMLSSILPLQDDVEDISNDTESLFTYILIKE